MAPHHHRTGNGHSSVPHHFFRFMLQHTLQTGKLKLPREFARVYGKALSNPVFLKVPDNKVWKLELTKYDGRLWLQKGWQKFAEHYSLEHGHSLVFRYEGNSHFHVVIFNKSATEIEYPCFDNNKEIQQPEAKIEESEDEPTEIMDDIASQKRKKPELQCSRPNKMMRSNPCDKTETTLKFESVATRFGHDNGFSAGKGEADCRVEGLRNDEKRKALQRVCSAFKTDNPNFLAVMQPAYVGLSLSHSFCLKLPKDFPSKYLKDHDDVILCDSNGKTWSAEYHSVRSRKSLPYAYLCNGWGAFVRDNNLQVGDICAFELIDSIKISFKVFIFRDEKADFHISQAFPDVSSPPTREAGNSSDVSSPPKREAGNSSAHQGCVEPQNAPERAMKARERALQRAKAFTSENPFFLVVLKWSYALGTCPLHVPHDFSRKYFDSTTTRIDVVLCLSNGKSWPAEYRQESIERPYGKICNGWREFAKENKLKIGDVCVFEMTYDTKITFKVFIFKAIVDEDCQPGQGVTKLKAVCSVQSLKFYETEKSRALERASATFKFENPSFMVFMQPTYLGLTSTSTYLLRIHIEFSRKYLMDHGDVILWNSSGNTWTVEYCSILGTNKKLYVRFCKGWGAFVQDNNILVGDVCAFELIKCNEITFKVFIYRSKEAIADINCRPTADVNSEPSQGVSQDPLGLTPQSPKAAREKAPFFSRVVLPTHLKENRVDMPFKFIEQYFEPNIQKLILKVGNRSWPVEITTDPRSCMAKLASGWIEFARENLLKVGDICVYEVDKVSNDLLKVSISRRRH